MFIIVIILYDLAFHIHKQISSPVEYSPTSSCPNDTDAPGRKTLNIITDGVLLYWIYYHDMSSQTTNRVGPANQSASTSGPSNTHGTVEVYLEVWELKVRF